MSAKPLIFMLDRSFFLPSPFPFSQLLSLECGYPEGYEPPQMSPKSIMCQQDPISAKIKAVMAEREDQVEKKEKNRKCHLITSPRFFTSVLINPPVHFSFIIPILSYSSPTPVAPILTPCFSTPHFCLVHIQDRETIIRGLEMGR